jgi:hypothetical protein
VEDLCWPSARKRTYAPGKWPIAVLARRAVFQGFPPPLHAVQLHAEQHSGRASGRSWDTSGKGSILRDWPALLCQTRRQQDSVARERDETVARWSRSLAKLRREWLEHKPPKHDTVPASTGCDPVGQRVLHRVAALNVTACLTSPLRDPVASAWRLSGGPRNA